MSANTHEATIRALDTRAPRYTSYPTADRFTDAFTAADQAGWLARRRDDTPLSLYVHVPFCESLCYYCACNKVITRDHGRSAPYLDRVEREADLVVERLGGGRRVSQMHWGGGSPTFLEPAQMARLARILRDRFDFLPHGDYSIEIDPRTIQPATMGLLAQMGLNRASLGVQDFDPDVQQAINRIQPPAMTLDIVDAARAAGFRSINFDLIYGLPRQAIASFGRTLDTVLEARPDRIALYNYAHLPQRFRAQRLIEPSGLPDAATKSALMALAMQRLTDAGYEHIGIDHFALPDDDLAVARRTGRLHRNFQGYTTQPECDLIGLGVSSISKVGAAYSQNARTVAEYYAAIDRGELPVWRGIELAADDLARRDVIMAMMCGGEVRFDDVSRAHGLDFAGTFATELSALTPLAEAGLIDLDSRRIAVTPAGLPYVRAISAAFDRHLRTGSSTATYSRVL